MVLRKLLEKVESSSVAADLDLDMEISGVCYDTRKLQPGELFVAVKGYEHNGNEFIKEAVSKGAVCIICEEPPRAETPFILVDDSRKALALVSAAWFGYPALKLNVIGVTGTNGKTTVTNLIKQVVETCSGTAAGLIGTNGNLIGDKLLPTDHTTPDSYELHRLLDAMVREGCRHVVMEVSSHALALNRVFGIEFAVGVFTNLTPEHLDFHESMDDYADVKALMFRNCCSAAINSDDEYARNMIDNAECPVVTYAVDDAAADVTAKSIKLLTDRVEFCALTIGNLNRIDLKIPGMFSVYNALAVISAVMLLGYDVESISDALRLCSGVKGRAEVVPAGRDFTVILDYAHTPDALYNIISAARGFALGRVVTLFGCGGDRDRKKRPLMGEIAVRNSDFVIITSDNPRTEEPSSIIHEILEGVSGTTTPYQVMENRREAINWALGNAEPGDVLIIAGKGHETYQIFGKEKTHFDEREVVAEYFSRADSMSGK